MPYRLIAVNCGYVYELDGEKLQLLITVCETECMAFSRSNSFVDRHNILLLLLLASPLNKVCTGFVQDLKRSCKIQDIEKCPCVLKYTVSSSDALESSNSNILECLRSFFGKILK